VDTVGKGTFYLLLAHGVSLATGYVIHVVLSRYLTPALYGTFGILFSLTANIGVLILSGLPNTVSKYVAEDYSQASAIKNEALKLQAVFSLGVFFLYFSLAEAAGRLFHDAGLARYLRLSATIIPVFALYSIFINLLNGLRQFKMQSVAIIAHQLIRMTAIVAFVAMGFSLGGAIAGLIFSALSGLMIGWALCRVEPSHRPFQATKLLKFAVPSTLFACTNVLFMNIDLLCIKALIVEGAPTGFYMAARVLSQPPSLAGIALAVVLYPSVSRSYASGEILQTRQYIRQSLRYLLLFLTPVTALIGATSENLIRWIYPEEFSQGGKALGILIVGQLLFACFVLLVTVISGTGYPQISMLLALLMLVLSLLLNLRLIPLYQLVGAALATLLATLPGVAMGGIYVYRKFRTLIPLRSLIKILIASGILYILAVKYPASGTTLLVQYAGFFGLYLLLLFLSWEFGAEDFKQLKGLLSAN